MSGTIPTGLVARRAAPLPAQGKMTRKVDCRIIKTPPLVRSGKEATNDGARDRDAR
jgi:hypothetical protein